MKRKILTSFLSLLFALMPFLQAQATQTGLPTTGYLGDPSRTTAQFQSGINDTVAVIKELVGGAGEQTATLSSDTLAPVVEKAIYALSPETGTADNLSTISITSARNGSVQVVRNANSANTITIKNAAGNIFTADGADVALNNTGDYIAFTYRSGSGWYELFRVERNKIKCLVGDTAESIATISSGALPISNALVRVRGEGNTTDNLDFISTTFNGSMIILRAYSETITVRNVGSPPTGYGQISTQDGASFELGTGSNQSKFAIFIRFAANPLLWVELYRSNSATLATKNYVNAGPGSVGDGLSSFRALVTADYFNSPWVNGGRLYAQSNGPSADSAGAATTVYWGAADGGYDAIALWDSSNSRWQTVSPGQKSLALTMTSGNCYDVFGYLSSGTLALETLAWTNATTRATALTTQNGVYVKNGDATRRYLGTIYASSANTFYDIPTRRGLYNANNRILKPMILTYTQTASHTYSTATTRAFDNNSIIGQGAVEFVYGGVAGAESWVSSVRGSVNSGVANRVAIGWGVDSTSAFTQSTNIIIPSTTLTASGSLTTTFNPYSASLGAGYHYIQLLERGNNGAGGGTQTWQTEADGSSDGRQCGMNFQSYFMTLVKIEKPRVIKLVPRKKTRAA